MFFVTLDIDDFRRALQRLTSRNIPRVFPRKRGRCSEWCTGATNVLALQYSIDVEMALLRLTVLNL